MKTDQRNVRLRNNINHFDAYDFWINYSNQGNYNPTTAEDAFQQGFTGQPISYQPDYNWDDLQIFKSTPNIIKLREI